MNEQEAKEELRLVLTELVGHLSMGWLYRMARGDRIQELQHRRLELLAIIVNFMTATERSSDTPSAPRGGDESGRGLGGV